MKHFLLAILISAAHAAFSQAVPTVTVPETIIGGQFYVVHSSMNNNNQLSNTSNIYLIKGMQDSVWIFGAGYGDSSSISETSDIEIYRGIPFEPARNAIDDATEVNSIITNSMGISSSQAKLMFVVPHFHLDHINKEFVDAFFNGFSYPQGPAKIYVHVNDSMGSVCNVKCCGPSHGCANVVDTFFAAPYRKGWSMPLINKFDAIGTPTDTCDHPILKFNSAMGVWAITKSLSKALGGHTEGAVNLKHFGYKIRVNGADGGTQCPLGNEWTKFGIHGDINIPPSLDVKGNVKEMVDFNMYPNPANNVVNLKFFQRNECNVSIELQDVLGKIVLRINKSYEAGEQHVVMNTNELDNGLYFCVIRSENGSGVKKLKIYK